jgi:RNA polymerase sigma-70 factor (ECF subfamily)
MLALVEPTGALSSEHAAEDAELVRLIGAAPPGGAREAETELCRRLAPRVRLYGLRHLRSDAAAADLTQQVLLVTLESLRAGRLREPAQLVSFVLGTCRLVVRDLRRGAARRERLLAAFPADLPAAEAPGPAPLDTARLAECLRRLPERERSIVILTFYAERSGAEVAADLGLTPANVRVIRHRALNRLRACLGGEERPA